MILQQLRCMVLGIYFLDDALQDAGFIEDECFAERAHRDLAVVLLLPPGTESLQHFRRRITQQRKR